MHNMLNTMQKMYIHTFSFIELLNRGRHSALWKWRPPRHDGRTLSRACVTRLSALSFGCFSYISSHSLLLLT